jgi:acetyltransferase-like isoleucine patch superfamily enzyme
VSKPILRRVCNRVFHYIARFGPGATSLRPFLHRARGVSIGPDVFIGEDVYLDNEYPECIEIHERAQINIRATIIAHTRGPGKVIIEKDAFVGPNTVIACSAGSVIKIGEGSVIGAGSVVTRSVPPRLFVAPVPIKPLARVDVPLTTAGSIAAFRSGLRPLTGEPHRHD